MTATDSTAEALRESALSCDPPDYGVMLVLADHCNDTGDEAGECFWRWMAEHRRRPKNQGGEGYGWNWGRPFREGSYWDLPPEWTKYAENYTFGDTISRAWQRAERACRLAYKEGWRP